MTEKKKDVVSPALRDLLETTHYTDPSWEGLDQIPDVDGKPGWDTPESAEDPDDDDEREEPARPTDRLPKD